MQTTGSSFEVQMNQFGFNINWASGQPVQTNALTSGTANFSDPQWTNYTSRFYRLRSP
jgi:hypothetical protein